MKRIISTVIAFFMVITCVSFILPEEARAVSYESGLDVVIVIDRSGSMKDNDPQKTAFSVAKALADVSSSPHNAANPNSGVHMAVIPYGYDLYNQGNLRFFNVSNPQELDALKSSIDNSLSPRALNAYDASQEDTNTGLALEKAYEMLAERKANFPNHSCSVLLLSDGAVLIGDSKGFRDENPGVYTGRNSQEAKDETAESIQKGNNASRAMKNDDIKLHCVGIYNKNTGIASLGQDMERWTTTTGGLYKTTESTNNNEELRKIVNEIYEVINPHANFATFPIGRDGGYFEIEEGVLQANIQVIPAFNDISKVELKHIVNGVEDPIILTQNSVRQSSTNQAQNTYTVISLPNPDPGKYHIKINDNRNFEFSLTVFSIRDLLMDLEPVDDAQNGDTIRFSLNITKDGTAYDTVDVPVITIKDKVNGQIAVNKTPMYKDSVAGAGWYYYEHTTTQMGSFTAQAQMMKDGYANYSNSVSYEVTQSPVRPLNQNAPQYYFLGHAITAYDAGGLQYAPYQDVYISYNDLESRYFSNPDNQIITGFTAYDDEGYLKIINDTQNRQFIVSPVRATGVDPYTFEIKAAFMGTESEPLYPTVVIEDLQGPVKKNDGLGYTDGAKLREIKGILPKEEIPETIETDEHGVVKFDNVEDFFVEPNANDYEHYSVICEIYDQNGDPSNGLKWRIDDQTKTLYLEGASEGTYTVKMIATSYDGSKAEYTFEVTVKDMLLTIIAIAGISLLAVIILVLIIRAAIVGPKPPFRHAMLNITLEYDGETEEGSVMLQRYGKKKVKLSTLCANNSIRMGKLRKSLEQITVAPKKNGGIHVHSNIKGIQVKDVVLHSMDGRTIELDPNGDRIIELEYDENESDY